MQIIPPPDSHHLLAAQGWIELSRYDEARRELDKIAGAIRNHPEVLEVDWLIHAHDQDWPACLQIAQAIVNSVPDIPLGWINQANSLFYMKRIQEAYDLLLPTVNRFPKNFIIPYNLACYTCQLGRRDEAWQWLDTAIRAGEKSAIKTAALRDPDLQPMWPKIQTI